MVIGMVAPSAWFGVVRAMLIRRTPTPTNKSSKTSQDLCRKVRLFMFHPPMMVMRGVV